MHAIFSKKIILFTAALVVFFVLMGLTTNPNSRLHGIRNIATVPVSYVQRIVSENMQKWQHTLDAIAEQRDLLEENRKLIQRINILESTNRELEAMQMENERLREALNLKMRYADYEIIGANVIAKGSGNWFDLFRVDVGQRDGVINDLAVITHDNCLIGRVYGTDHNSSMVVTIIDQTMAISGWISKPGGGAVTVRGDIHLKNEGLCRITNINLDVHIAVGDIIETSGLGGIYPKGIVIGEVISVINTPSSLERYALLKPHADFKRIDEVFILKHD